MDPHTLFVEFIQAAGQQLPYGLVRDQSPAARPPVISSPYGEVLRDGLDEVRRVRLDDDVLRTPRLLRFRVPLPALGREPHRARDADPCGGELGALVGVGVLRVVGQAEGDVSPLGGVALEVPEIDPTGGLGGGRPAVGAAAVPGAGPADGDDEGLGEDLAVLAAGGVVEAPGALHLVRVQGHVARAGVQAAHGPPELRGGGRHGAKLVGVVVIAPFPLVHTRIGAGGVRRWRGRGGVVVRPGRGITEPCGLEHGYIGTRNSRFRK